MAPVVWKNSFFDFTLCWGSHQSFPSFQTNVRMVSFPLKPIVQVRDADVSRFLVFWNIVFFWIWLLAIKTEFYAFAQFFWFETVERLKRQKLHEKICSKRPPAERETSFKIFPDNQGHKFIAKTAFYRYLQKKSSILRLDFSFLKAKRAEIRIFPVCPVFWPTNADHGPDTDLRPKILSLKS